MVVRVFQNRTCAETAAVSRGTMQQPKSSAGTPLGYSHSLTITCDMSAVSLIESRDPRWIKVNSNKCWVQCVRAGSGVWGTKGQPLEGRSRADLPESRWSAKLLSWRSIRIIIEQSKTKLPTDTGQISNMQPPPAQRVYVAKPAACSWPAAKLAVWEHSAIKWTWNAWLRLIRVGKGED